MAAKSKADRDASRFRRAYGTLEGAEGFAQEDLKNNDVQSNVADASLEAKSKNRWLRMAAERSAADLNASRFRRAYGTLEGAKELAQEDWKNVQSSVMKTLVLQHLAEEGVPLATQLFEKAAGVMENQRVNDLISEMRKGYGGVFSALTHDVMHDEK
jgi:hypothetical protein